MVAQETPEGSTQPVQGTSPDDSRPFVRIGRLVSLPGYKHAIAEFRDYVRPGESLEEAGERLSILCDRRVRADTRKITGYDYEGPVQTSLDGLTG